MKPTIGRIVHCSMKGDDKPMAAIVTEVLEWKPPEAIAGCIAMVNLTYFWHVGGAAGWISVPFFETEEAARQHPSGMVAWWPPRVE